MTCASSTQPPHAVIRPACDGPALSPPKPGELQSAQLFGSAQAVVIHHGGERYTLRHTSKGKLILTK